MRDFNPGKFGYFKKLKTMESDLAAAVVDSWDGSLAQRLIPDDQAIARLDQDDQIAA